MFTDDQRKQFVDIFNQLGKYYQRNDIDAPLIQMYYALLRGYTLDQIKGAVNKHMVCPKEGQYFPRVSSLVRFLVGSSRETISAEDIVSAAMHPSTPMGCLARIALGTWDLGVRDMYYLKQRAAGILPQLGVWEAKAREGQYSDHEVMVMLKHGVSPTGNFITGDEPPIKSALIEERVRKVKKSTSYHDFSTRLPASEAENPKTGKPHPSVIDIIAQLNAALSDDGSAAIS